MKKKKQKILTSLSVMALALAFIVLPQRAMAENTGKDLQDNKWNYSRTNGSKEKTFTYTMTKPGKINIRVVPYGNSESASDWTFGQAIDKSFYLNVSLQHYSNDPYNPVMELTDRKISCSNPYESGKMDVSVGTKVVVKVKDDKKWKSRFKVKVTYYKPSNFEVENNNSVATAMKIQPNKTYYGNCEKGDTDYFVMTAPKDGQYLLSAESFACDYDEFERIKVYVNGKCKKTTGLGKYKGWENVYYIELKKGDTLTIQVYDGGFCESYRFKVRMATPDTDKHVWAYNWKISFPTYDNKGEVTGSHYMIVTTCSKCGYIKDILGEGDEFYIDLPIWPNY